MNTSKKSTNTTFEKAELNGGLADAQTLVTVDQFRIELTIPNQIVLLDWLRNSFPS